MKEQTAWTAESIHAMAEEAGELVAASSNWMLELQNLPIEEAEAEYAKSPNEGDRLVREMRRASDAYYAAKERSDDWVNIFINSIAEPFEQPSRAANLLATSLQFPQGAFGGQWWVDNPTELSVLQNCAHPPDFRLVAECRIAMWFWEPEMNFRNGFDAAAFFGNQVYHYEDRIFGLDRIGSDHGSVNTFRDVLDICRSERSDARDCLRPCTCIPELQTIIEYESAWLLHSCCGHPEPQRWSPKTPFLLTDVYRTDDSEASSDVVGKLSEPAEERRRGRPQLSPTDTVEKRVEGLVKSGRFKRKPRELAREAGAFDEDGEPDVLLVQRVAARFRQRRSRKKV